jgi:hypothetical protein
MAWIASLYRIDIVLGTICGMFYRIESNDGYLQLFAAYDCRPFRHGISHQHVPISNLTNIGFPYSGLLGKELVENEGRYLWCFSVNKAPYSGPAKFSATAVDLVAPYWFVCGAIVGTALAVFVLRLRRGRGVAFEIN